MELLQEWWEPVFASTVAFLVAIVLWECRVWATRLLAMGVMLLRWAIRSALRGLRRVALYLSWKVFTTLVKHDAEVRLEQPQNAVSKEADKVKEDT